MNEDTDIPYTERDLIQRAINSASARHTSECVIGIASPKPRWRIANDVFFCGPTVATAICYRYGFDPEKMIGGEE
jgi:hypothetical protein